MLGKERMSRGALPVIEKKALPGGWSRQGLHSKTAPAKRLFLKEQWN